MLIMNIYIKNYPECNFLILELQFQLVFWESALLDMLPYSCFLPCASGQVSIIYGGAFYFFFLPQEIITVEKI